MIRTGALITLAVLLVGVGVMFLPSCAETPASAATVNGGRLLVLGFDGMDPKILQRLMDAGRMPNFKSVAQQGAFVPLATSMPPQSPVAWSDFISGSHAGTHQIFDFIHRDPSPADVTRSDGTVYEIALLPDFSMSATVPVEVPWYASWLPNPIPWFDGTVGDQTVSFEIPLSGETVELLRRGGDFWTPLIERGIPTAIYRVPANYPPPSLDGRACKCAMSGMGTPDIMGSYGEFTLFTQNVSPRGRRPPGGRFVYLPVRRHRGKAVLEGPDNFLVKPDDKGRVPPLRLELEFVRDPEHDVVTISIGDQVVLLKQGEWSDWVQFEFDTGVKAGWLLGSMGLPTTLPAMVRFFAKKVHPRLEVFVTPMNFDPTNPVNAISEPEDFSAELAEACGLYHTTGIPEHTAILTRGALNEDEYLQHCRIILDERIRQYRYALENFEAGFLFFYFGTTDQLAHIFWRDTDPDHPGRVEEQAEKYATVIDDCYVEMDGLVGEALERLHENDTLVLMSDHGFGSFRRGFNLNTWLVNEGYLELEDPALQEDRSILDNTRWDRTRAYAIGINSLYVNLKGREKLGSVAETERDALLREIGDKLLEVRDDGAKVIEKVYYVKEFYPGADPKIAPDMLVGYAMNYRASWGTVLGGTPRELLEDNLERWSGDHCVAAHLVPGILVTNRKVIVDEPSLSDMAPTILGAFGIPKPKEMDGRSVLDFQD